MAEQATFVEPVDHHIEGERAARQDLESGGDDQIILGVVVRIHGSRRYRTSVVLASGCRDVSDRRM